MLDLADEATVDTAKACVALASKRGYQLSILNITIDEAQTLLYRVAANLDGSLFTATLDPHSIEAACARRRLTKTQLERIGGKLPRTLSDAGVETVEVDESLQALAQTSDVYKANLERTHNRAGAAHDGIAFFYVQQKRGREVALFREAKSWFLGIRPSRVVPDFYRRKDPESGEVLLGERLYADVFVNILWMSEPHVKVDDFANHGLTRLVATALADRRPEPHLVRDLDRLFQEHEEEIREEVSADDLAFLATSDALKTQENFGRVRAAAQESPEALGRVIRDLAAHQRARQEAARAASDAAASDLQQRVQQAEERADLMDARLQLRQQIHRKELELENLEGQIVATQTEVESIESVAAKSVRRIEVGVILVYLLLYAMLLVQWHRSGWPAIEGPVWFLTALPVLLGLLGFCLSGGSVKPGVAHTHLRKKFIDCRMQKRGNPRDRLRKLRNQRDAPREELERLSALAEDE